MACMERSSVLVGKMEGGRDIGRCCREKKDGC